MADPLDSSVDAGGGGDDADWHGRTMQRDPMVGRRLGEYIVEERIGIGGMGIVYRGRQPDIGKPVAIKVLRPEIADDPDQVQRLLSEARAVNAIGHRGIIDIFSFGVLQDGRHYFVMELLNGQPLDVVMAERGPMPATEVIPLLEDILVPLGAAHAAGVIHRDLKPNNLFLVNQPDGSQFLKILDFGLAKQAMTPGGLTPQTRNAIVGTPEYMAPEQARGAPVGPRTDLYAIGVIAYQMLTARLPFLEDSAIATLMAHLEKPPTPLSQLVGGLPDELEDIVLQLLAKSPDDRPPSADLVRQKLRALRKQLQMEGTQIRRVAFPTPPLSPPPGMPLGSRNLRPISGPVPVPAPPTSSRPVSGPLPVPPASFGPAPTEAPSEPSRKGSLGLWIGMIAAVLVAAASLLWGIRSHRVSAARAEPPVKSQPSGTAPTVMPPPTQGRSGGVASPPSPAHADTAPPAKTPSPTPALPTKASPPANGVTRVAVAHHPARRPIARPHRPDRPAGPTRRNLRKRIREMRRQVYAQTPKGEEPDSLVLQLLDRQSDLVPTSTPSERTRISAYLDDLEKKFLSRPQ